MIKSQRRRAGAVLGVVALIAVVLVPAALAPSAARADDRAGDGTDGRPSRAVGRGDLFGRPLERPNADIAIAPGFVDQTVLTGLRHPTAVRFAADGSVFVAEKAGLVKRFDSLADTTATTVADLRVKVYNYWDRGMLGMEVDRQFPTRPYLYVLYAHDAPIGGTAPYWGSTANPADDPCPNPPGSTTDGCVSSSRLSRLTVGASGLVTGEKVLVEDWCGQFPSHGIGTVLMGADGYLYAGAGDGASFAIGSVDYGQYGGSLAGTPTPKNPCGDPPGGVGGPMSPPTAEGGSLRAQDRRTTDDPTGLDGTLIRVDPDTGVAAPSNPGYGTARDANDERIVAFGLRNPFRFTWRAGKNEVWLGDVGAGRWEEIIRLDAAATGIPNHGWPCYEGVDRNGPWDGLNMNLCESLYSAGTARNAYWAYRHGQAVVAGEACPTGGGVVSGLSFYNGGDYPASYDGALFFADFGRRCIWAMKQGANGDPDPSQIVTVVDNAAGPVDLQVGPGGDVFYVDLDGGAIHRLRYTAGGGGGDNRAPVIVATANPTSGSAPLSVQFDSDASYDPDGDGLSWAWEFTGDGRYDDSFQSAPLRSFGTEGIHIASLRLTDSHGLSSTKDFTIRVGDPPEPVIDTPAAGSTWRVGQTISFSGHASDPDEGTIPTSRLRWSIVMNHCPSTCHSHIVQSIDGVASGSFVAPDHEYPSHLELRLTATDSIGIERTVTRRLDPRTVTLTFATQPAGLRLAAAGHDEAAPFSETVIVGSAVLLDAPSPQTLNGTSYAFARWSDGGARNHQITAPGTNTTYTATYTAGGTDTDAPDRCEDVSGVTLFGRWIKDAITDSTDEDWFRVRTDRSAHARMILGRLPANYRLDLYGACGTLIASSNRFEKQYEEIYRHLPAGTYHIRVKGFSGASSANQYQLRFWSLQEGLQVLSSDGWIDSHERLRIAGEVLNNTSTRQRNVVVRATLYNSANQVIGTVDQPVFLDIVRGRMTSPFLFVVEEPPAGYHRHQLSVTGTPTTDDVVRNLALRNVAVSVPQAGERIYTGSVRNDNTFTVRGTKVATTLYDNSGYVLNARLDMLVPSDLAPGASGDFRARFVGHCTGVNRTGFHVEASR